MKIKSVSTEEEVKKGVTDRVDLVLKLLKFPSRPNEVILAARDLNNLSEEWYFILSISENGVLNLIPSLKNNPLGILVDPLDGRFVRIVYGN